LYRESKRISKEKSLKTTNYKNLRKYRNTKKNQEIWSARKFEELQKKEGETRSKRSFERKNNKAVLNKVK
jgi:hypothetical protein